MSEEVPLNNVIEHDDRVKKVVLQSSYSHAEATRQINELGYSTTESSVRRARKSGRKTYLILSDWQCDLQDDGFLWRVYNLAQDLQPDGIVHVGDENDTSTISRWVKGMPEEYDLNCLQRQVDETYLWLKKFRNIPSVKSFDIAYSNHGHRFSQSLKSRVPGWKDMRVVQYEHIMREAAWYHGDEPLDIRFDVPVIHTIPGVAVGHGDQWNLSSKSQYAQMSEQARIMGKSLIAGHTHRPMLATVSYRDENDVQQSRFIMNVGNSMDVTQAEYMNVDRGYTPQWGQAVGVVTSDGVNAYPELVTDINQTMFFRGKVY